MQVRARDKCAEKQSMRIIAHASGNDMVTDKVLLSQRLTNFLLVTSGITLSSRVSASQSLSYSQRLNPPTPVFAVNFENK
jgi:hypothetical protein